MHVTLHQHNVRSAYTADEPMVMIENPCGPLINVCVCVRVCVCACACARVQAVYECSHLAAHTDNAEIKPCVRGRREFLNRLILNITPALLAATTSNPLTQPVNSFLHVLNGSQHNLSIQVVSQFADELTLNRQLEKKNN